MMPRPRLLLLPLALAAACVSASRTATPASPAPCASPALVPVRGPSETPESPPPVSPSLESAPRSAALRPGRYWFHNAGCEVLDVRMVRRDGDSELAEFSMYVAGGAHSSEGTVFYLARERVLVGGGFRHGAVSLELGCNVRRELPAVSGGAFGGVPLFDDLESCEAQDCSDGSCVARFELGDCRASVATSARRLRRVTGAEEASRQRTLVRFQRIGRRGRLWRAGWSECVAVQAKRDGAELELRYSESVEDVREDTTETYTLAPLDLRASLNSFTTIYTPTEGGIGGIGRASGAGIPLYFGDGVIVLGTADLFFERAACEASRARHEAASRTR